MFEYGRMTEHHVISLGDFNFNYILDETLFTYPTHYIETAYEYAPVNSPANTSGR